MGQNSQKNFKHDVSKKRSPGSLDSTFYISPVNLNKISQVVPEKSWLPQEALLKMDFQQKLHNSAIFVYFYLKIIWKVLQ